METTTKITRWAKYSETYKAYYQENKQEVLDKNKEWKKQNPEKYLLNSCKQRARISGIDFSIDLRDLAIPSHCPYLKVLLVPDTVYAPSVDRIDNTQGYIKGNIEVISMKANRMKNNATSEELIAFAEYILSKDLDDRYKGK